MFYICHYNHCRETVLLSFRLNLAQNFFYLLKTAPLQVTICQTLPHHDESLHPMVSISKKILVTGSLGYQGKIKHHKQEKGIGKVLKKLFP